MKLTSVDYTKPLKVLINGVEYECDRNINLSDHVFNHANSQLRLKNVYPKGASAQRVDVYKLKKFSICEIYFGNELFYFGLVKVQSGGSLNPRKPKHFDLTIVSYKEWLIHQFMDFPIFNMSHDDIVHKVISTLNNPRIVVGSLSYGNTDFVKVYNTKSKNAWDILRLVEKHSNSMLQINVEANKTLSINFFNKQSIININNGNKGADIDFSTPANFDLFDKTYGVKDFEWAENNMKNRNFIRVESEATISNKITKQEIDLAQGQSTINLLFGVGKVDKHKTILKLANGTERKLIVVSQKEASKGKQNDIIYSFNSNTITLNKRHVGTGNKITFAYHSILRQSLDLQDHKDQKNVSINADGGSGILTQYEKYNDITNLDDLLALGKRHLINSTDEKVKLIMTTLNPVWELGQHTLYKNATNQELSGDYIVREVKVNIVGDSHDGTMHKTFEYHLVKSQDLENERNFNDSLAYRDNPVFDVEGSTIDTTTSIEQKLYVLVDNLDHSCENIDHTYGSLQSQLQSSLAGNPADAGKVKHKEWII